MPLLAILLPRTESSMKVLESILIRISLKYKDVALPIPTELCIESITGKPQLESLDELRSISNALVKLWQWVPKFMRTLFKLDPSINITCYLNMYEVKESANTAIELARLVLRAKLGGPVNVHEWLSTVKHAVRSRVPENTVVVIDNYPLYLDTVRYTNTDIVTIGPFIPTPVDLLHLIRIGVINEHFIDNVVNYVVRYIGDYVVYSRDLTESYQRLLTDNDYLEFIKKLGLRIIT